MGEPPINLSFLILCKFQTLIIFYSVFVAEIFIQVLYQPITLKPDQIGMSKDYIVVEITIAGDGMFLFLFALKFLVQKSKQSKVRKKSDAQNSLA